jgi:chromosome segregation ATPase
MRYISYLSLIMVTENTRSTPAGLPQLDAAPRRRAVRGRWLTQTRVAAVCEQLGEDVSVRNVQRILGGSLRDLAPKVRAWRETHASPAAADPSMADQRGALAALVASDLDAIEARAVQRHEQLLQVFRGSNIGSRATAAPSTRDDAPLLKRLEGLEKKLDTLATARSTDTLLTSLRALTEARREPDKQIQELLQAVQRLPVDVEALVKAGTARDQQLEALLQRLDALTVSSVAVAEPAPRRLDPDLAAVQEEAERHQVLDQRLAELVQAMAGQRALLEALLAAHRNGETPAEALATLVQGHDMLATTFATLHQKDRAVLSRLTRHVAALGEQLGALQQQIAALRPPAKKRAVRRKVRPPAKKKTTASRPKKKGVSRASGKTAAGAAKRKAPRRAISPTTRKKKAVTKKHALVPASRSPARSTRKATRPAVTRKKVAKKSTVKRTAATPRKAAAKRTKSSTSTARRSAPTLTASRRKAVKSAVRTTARVTKPRKPATKTATKKTLKKFSRVAPAMKPRTQARSSTPTPKLKKRR